MHTLILTCAGQSTRFPNDRPKWSLTHPSGNMMAAEAVRGISGYDRLVMVVNALDAVRYEENQIYRELRLGGTPLDALIVIESTASQVETAIRALSEPIFNREDPFTIKDCDNYFRYELPRDPTNQVAVVDLHKTGPIIPGNKSYVSLVNRLSMRVGGIAERQILSNLFCCGAYSFFSVGHFLTHAASATWISAVMGRMLNEQLFVFAKEATHYEDWGTAEDWQRYKAAHRTLFVDIDGVVLTSSHRSFRPSWAEARQIPANVEYLNLLVSSGKIELVLTTARPEEMRAVTVQQLEGLKWSKLLMGLRTVARVLVNDVVPGRVEDTAHAVNVERDGPLEPALAKVLR